jgi:hypothetical protein
MAAGVYLSEAPFPPKSFWGGKALLYVRNLVKYTVYNSCICSPHNLIPSPPSVTHFINTYPCTYSHKQGGR